MTKFKGLKSALVTSVVSLFLCVAMLVGTTFAWFTDTVTSANNIIQTGTLKVAFEYAKGNEAPDSAAWADASKNAIFDYNNWEPGYVDAKHLRITNVGTLALNYQLRIITDVEVSKLADVIDVYYFETATQLGRSDVEGGTKLGTLAEIMGTAFNISKTVKGKLEKGDVRTLTLALKMQDTAGNEYQNIAVADSFKVQLIATQASSEPDSFGPDYDAIVPDPAIPAALVRPLDDLSVDVGIHSDYGDIEGKLLLDIGYNFHPTEGRPENPSFGEPGAGHLEYDPNYSVENSEYRYWHADFVVKADKDVPAGSMALAGYYSFFCELANDGKWIALTADTVTAGTEIRLVDAMAGGAITVSWEDICSYGNDGIGFACGAVDLTGENAGTTLTVELYIYETGCDDPGCHHAGKDCEIVGGKSIKVGDFKYTFPATPVVDQNGLNDAIANGDNDIVLNLGAGDYVLPNTNGKNVEIIGTKDTVIDVTGGYYADQANLVFKGVTFDCTVDNPNGGDYELIYSPNVTFIDCTFNGSHGVGRDGATYKNCTFNLPVDYVWSFANDTVFDGCTFNSQGKALLLYNHGGSEMVNITVKNCVFNATEGAKAGAIANQNCAAIEIDNYGCSINLIVENNTVDSDFSGEWRIKSFYGNGNTVTVNGTSYNTIAIDGHTMTIDANKNVTVQ